MLDNFNKFLKKRGQQPINTAPDPGIGTGTAEELLMLVEKELGMPDKNITYKNSISNITNTTSPETEEKEAVQ